MSLFSPARKSSEGVITQWDDAGAYGFITAVNSRRLFFHISNMAEEQYRPRVGEKVTFSIRHNAQNRPYADNIRYIGEVHDADSSGDGSADSWWTIRLAAHCSYAGFLFYPLFFYLFRQKITAVALAMLCNSLLTLLFYYADKCSARSGAERIPEKTLHLWELAGGWPGALTAQHWLHHKNRKAAFLAQSYLMILLNILLLWGTDHLFRRLTSLIRALFSALMKDIPQLILQTIERFLS